MTNKTIKYDLRLWSGMSTWERQFFFLTLIRDFYQRKWGITRFFLSKLKKKKRKLNRYGARALWFSCFNNPITSFEIVLVRLRVPTNVIKSKLNFLRIFFPLRPSRTLFLYLVSSEEELLLKCVYVVHSPCCRYKISCCKSARGSPTFALYLKNIFRVLTVERVAIR